MAEQTKVCPRCREEKPWRAFGMRRRGDSMLPRTYCYPCARARDRARKESPRDIGLRRLPIEPFREWLDAFIAEERVVKATDRNNESEMSVVYERLALALGSDTANVKRLVHRWRNESQWIPLDYADAVLTRLDSAARLAELWPELGSLGPLGRVVA